MIKTEIYIENKLLDISADLESLITFAIDDIKDIGSRNTSFSKTIVLPGTANNNFLFGHIFDVKVSNPYDDGEPNVGFNFNAAKQADCLIFQDHLQVFKGIIRVLKIVLFQGVYEYECAVFGELGGLINAMGAKKIEELDFSEWDHTYSIANVTASWDNINGSGYYYPLADYGNVSTNKIDYDISALRPALYVKDYLNKIFESAGYDYECDLFETARFESLIIPNKQKAFQKLSNTLLNVFTTTGYTIISSSGPGAPQDVSFDTLGILGSFSANVDKDQFTWGAADTYSTFFTVELNIALQGQLYSFYFRLYQNANIIFEQEIYRTSNDVLFTTIVIDNLEVQVEQNDVFRVEVTASNTGGGVGSWFVDINEAIWTVQTTNEVYVDVNLGDTITITDTVPKNVLQRDFLSSILRLFNLYVSEDKLKSKFLRITPYVDFYDTNASGVLDWTYKLDRQKTIDIVPMSELNSRFYDFKFKQDSDYYNELYRNRYGEGYGDYLYDSQFDFANDRTDISVIFSGTPLVGYSGVDKIVPAYYKLSNANEDTMDVNIRILLAKKITGVADWDILDGVSTIVSNLTSYGYAGHYDDPDAPANDIHFGVPRELFFTLVTGAINVTQFNVYWSPYMAEITDKDSKLIIGSFKLTNRDIYELDFSKFIYVDGAYFRLNKIEDWNANEPDLCRVSLLKVINTVY